MTSLRGAVAAGVKGRSDFRQSSAGSVRIVGDNTCFKKPF